MPSASKKKLRPRVVSAPRSKQAKARVNFRMAEDELKALDEAAGKHHRSRSELILLGLQRCLADGLWQATPMPASVTAHPRDTVSPAPELVVLSQVLMSAVMGIEALHAGKRRSSTAMKEARDSLADARTMLTELLEGLRCS